MVPSRSRSVPEKTTGHTKDGGERERERERERGGEERENRKKKKRDEADLGKKQGKKRRVGS